MRRPFGFAALCVLLATPVFADAIATMFYPHENFGGTPVHAAVTSCRDTAAPSCFLPSMPFTIASIKPGGSTRGKSADRSWVRVALFEKPDYEGICSSFDRDAPSLSDSLLGSRAVRSFRIGQGCPAEVVLYSDPQFGGSAVGLTGSVPALATVNFNDLASSARMNGATSVALFENNNYEGNCIVLRADAPSIEMTARASSAIVNGRCPKKFRITIVNNAMYALAYRIAARNTGTLTPSASKDFDFVHDERGSDDSVNVAMSSLNERGRQVTRFFNVKVTDDVKIVATGTLPDGTVAGASCEPASACR